MPNESKWKVGDLVRLKSGGPTMTVEGYITTASDDEDAINDVRCSWFPRNALTTSLEWAARPEVADFSEEALEAVTP